MKIFILIFVILTNPQDQEKNNILEIISYRGQPLVFESYEQCFSHIENHLEELHNFSREYFNQPLTIEQIVCAPKIESADV
jgi:hypothetical protein